MEIWNIVIIYLSLGILRYWIQLDLNLKIIEYAISCAIWHKQASKEELYEELGIEEPNLVRKIISKIFLPTDALISIPLSIFLLLLRFRGQ